MTKIVAMNATSTLHPRPSSSGPMSLCVFRKFAVPIPPALAWPRPSRTSVPKSGMPARTVPRSASESSVVLTAVAVIVAIVPGVTPATTLEPAFASRSAKTRSVAMTAVPGVVAPVATAKPAMPGASAFASPSAPFRTAVPRNVAAMVVAVNVVSARRDISVLMPASVRAAALTAVAMEFAILARARTATTVLRTVSARIHAAKSTSR